MGRGAGRLVSLALAMGIGRFAFTPLPMMLHDGTVTLAGAVRWRR
jgi:hypothetical protein